MQDCVFCKIVKGEIDSAKIWEDEEFLAILDVNPNTKGVVLVLTKNHYSSYLFGLADNLSEKIIRACKGVARILEKGLNVKRVGMAMEGMGINHAHIKLYPFFGLDEWREQVSKERVFFEKYPGHLTTELGPQVALEELKKLAKEIKKEVDKKEVDKKINN